MAHKGAYVTNINELIVFSAQQRNHKKYIEQLQHLLKSHQRGRRCLPDPKEGIHSKQAKRPLPTSPCFRNQNQIEQQPTNLNVEDLNRLNAYRSRSRNSSRAAIAGSALSNFNSITCFSSSSPIPHYRAAALRRKEEEEEQSTIIPTVIVTSEGNQTIYPFPNSNNNMPPSSVHPVNRNTNHPLHSNHAAPTTSAVQTVTHNNPATATNQQTSHLRKMVRFKEDFKLPSSTANNGILNQRTSSAPPLYRSISESSLINCVSSF